MDNLKNKAAGIAVAVTLSVGGAVAIDQTQQAIPIQCDIEKAQAHDLETKLKTYRVDEGFLQTREMTKEDRASIKGCEYAKEAAKLIKNKFIGGKYDIEIESVEPIDEGVQIFARAWTKDGNQVGFGKDGSIDIERFRIFNPPVLVPDEKGTITRDIYDEDGVFVRQAKYREDVSAALFEAIEFSISNKKEVFGPQNIEKGKRGNTTSTFYSNTADAGPSIPNRATFAAARGATSVSADPALTSRFIAAAERETAGSTFNVARGFFPFDASAIADTDTISSATLTFTKSGGANAQTAGVTLATLASAPTYAAGDFDGITLNSPAEGTDSRVDTNVSNESTFAFSLNATGIGWISKTTWTVFCIRYTGDIDNVTPPNSTRRYTETYYADNTGTTKDPVLVVEHSGAATDGPTPGANDPIWMK